jgi:hypothetical protein
MIVLGAASVQNWKNQYGTTKTGSNNAGNSYTWYSAVGTANFQSAKTVSFGYAENLNAANASLSCYFVVANWV